jgi:hypothetical protein
MKWNPKKICNDLVVNETLKIYNDLVVKES